MGSGTDAGDNGDRKAWNSNENSSAPQIQKSETNTESLDGGHGVRKRYRGFTDDRHSHAPIKRGRCLNKKPTGGLYCERAHHGTCGPRTRIRHTGSAVSSGGQGATSLNGLAHLDGMLDTKTGMMGRDLVTSESAMNVTPHGRGYMRSSLHKSCYMEGQSGEWGRPQGGRPQSSTLWR